jgi:hypothetical protein
VISSIKQRSSTPCELSVFASLPASGRQVTHVRTLTALSIMGPMYRGVVKSPGARHGS